MEGDIGPEIASLRCLKTFKADHNFLTSVSLSLFLIESLEECCLSNNPNLKQPPVYEVEQAQNQNRTGRLNIRCLKIITVFVIPVLLLMFVAAR